MYYLRTYPHNALENSNGCDALMYKVKCDPTTPTKPTCQEHLTAQLSTQAVTQPDVNHSVTKDFEGPPLYLYAVSRTIELSLQSSFQLSLTVLVDYRSFGCI